MFSFNGFRENINGMPLNYQMTHQRTLFNDELGLL